MGREVPSSQVSAVIPQLTVKPGSVAGQNAEAPTALWVLKCSSQPASGTSSECHRSPERSMSRQCPPPARFFRSIRR